MISDSLMEILKAFPTGGRLRFNSLIGSARLLQLAASAYVIWCGNMNVAQLRKHQQLLAFQRS